MSENIYARVRAAVIEVVRAVVPDMPVEALARIEVSPAKEPGHGDMATNAAMVIAKAARQSPKLLAEAIAAGLTGGTDVETAAAAGPGFVNLTLRIDTLRAVVGDVLRAGEAFGASQAGAGRPVNVEYVSANPTGPMHIGHCRGAVVGDALANLLGKAGFDVTKEYYVNDAGAQVAALAWAAYWRYLQALGTTLTEDEFAAATPTGLQYKGDYLLPVGAALQATHGAALAGPDHTIADPALWFDTVRDTAIAMMMESIRADLAALGVSFDVFTSERALLESGAPDRAIERLRTDGLVYEGVLEPPKGKMPDDWEPREQDPVPLDPVRRRRRPRAPQIRRLQHLFRQRHRQPRRQDGARRLADDRRLGRRSRRLRLAHESAATRALAGNGDQRLEIVLCQIVHVLRDGQPVRMSKRAGTYVTLADLLEWVGRDVVRFTMLTRKSDAQMEFDLDMAVAQTRENPVFYVQYAHARCRSVLRAAAEAGHDTAPAALETAGLDSLEADAELALIRRLASWPRTVEAAALAQEPHRIAFYLYDLAGDFHMLWNRGRDDSTLRFLQADRPAETLARLALVEATATTIRSGLAVLGVTPVEEMR